MKYFASIFAMCLIVFYLFMFFGGAYNIWALLIAASLAAALIIIGFIKQEERLEKLEARLENLEKSEKSEPLEK